ncbi:Homeobox-leucine zipper protein ATHB-9 [Acorus gramineus]|uniref:Homeobox-leucine zipper protein ATHB-9 n=1 Tax=Acorus gramineus TaxID=55184 RepID=A0AAV9API1_ACOGR|nr:Homeobox-leucine zipper protein ATHB-9 [Acorus gramineus]
MGLSKSPLSLGLLVALFVGFAVYFRLQEIDSAFAFEEDLLSIDCLRSGEDTMLKNLWDSRDAILCCSLKAGFDMVERLEELHDMFLDETLDPKMLCSEFSDIIEQGKSYFGGWT